MPHYKESSISSKSGRLKLRPPTKIITIGKNDTSSYVRRNEKRNRSRMTPKKEKFSNRCFPLLFCPPEAERNVVFCDDNDDDETDQAVLVANHDYKATGRQRADLNYAQDDRGEEEEDYPVEIILETPESYNDCPRILTPKMMQKLVDDALPAVVKTMRWNRIYAAGRDGDAVCTFLQRCSSFKHTIIVTQTTRGDIIGGYATEPWKRQEGTDSKRTFYGSGQSFLFSNHPYLQQQSNIEKDNKQTNNHNNSLSIFKWSGMNTYAQICDAEEGLIAMGGGGSFGLVLQDSFTRGSTGYCSTFANPPLIQNNDGCFDITDFEVWGFESICFSSRSDVSTVSLHSLLTAELEDSENEPCSD